MLRRLRLCASVLALFAAASGAHAGTIFEQTFSGGLGAKESVHGGFAVANGAVGHASAYAPNEHSWYELSLDLTGYKSAAMLFDWTMSSEYMYDGWNLKSSVAGGDYLALTGVNTPYNHVVRHIGAAATGFGSGTAGVDLTPFVGKVVNLRWSFTSDHGIQGLGVRFDNVLVTGEALAPTPGGAVPEPATWAMMIGGFGAIGASLRRRRRDESFV